ncbi:hypothetical protein CP8484711_0351, partial [Chlamydia psittaci 84-8471/1]
IFSPERVLNFFPSESRTRPKPT